MNKPATLIYNDFRQDLAKLINDSGLPAFIIELVLQNCLHEVKAIRENQYRLDKTEYEQSLKTE